MSKMMETVEVVKEAQGYLVVTRYFKDGSSEQVKLKNLVVAKAREIVRDLVYGDSGSITGLSLGDANINPSKALNKDHIPDPSVVDTSLVHKTFEARIIEKSKVVYEDRPAIKFSFFIDYDEGNGNGTDNFFTEAGLTIADGTLFTRLTFRALTKDNTSSLSLDYFLLF